MDMIQNILEQLARIEHNTMLASKNVLNIDDVAHLTGYSRSHLYKLTSESKIPFYKPNGKTLFFRRSEIEQWMCQGRNTTQDEANNAALKYLVNN